MTKTLTKLLFVALLMLFTFNIQAQEIDSLYVNSTDNELRTVHMLDSVFKNVDVTQVPPLDSK